MKQVNQLRQNYQRILKISCPTLKKMLLEGLKEQLSQMERALRQENIPNNEKQQITQTIETNTSHLSIISNSFTHDFSSDNRILPSILTGNDELQELQGRIIKKQKLKIAYNQAIEEHEEKYFDMQSTIYFQQEKIQRLDKQISKKSYEISKISAEESVEIRQKDEQTPSFAHKFICFFLS